MLASAQPGNWMHLKNNIFINSMCMLAGPPIPRPATAGLGCFRYAPVSFRLRKRMQAFMSGVSVKSCSQPNDRIDKL